MKTLEYYAKPDCAPCEVEWLHLLRSNLGEAYDIQKVDTTSHSGLARAKTLGIKAVPTVVVLNEFNDVIDSAIGARAVSDLIDSLE